MGSYKSKQNKRFYRINHYITAPTVRLIQADGKQIGILPLTEAHQKANQADLDLVEIAPKANPPVVKLINFAKFKYQEAKKRKIEKRSNRGGGLKEIQMKPFIGLGDYHTKIKKAKKFLSTGNKVKLSIKFQGRQIIHQEFGYDLVEKVKKDLIETGSPEGEARLVGKRLLITFTGIKNKPTKKNNEKNKQKIQNKKVRP